MRIKIKKLHEDAKIPTYATPGAAGFDLVAIEDIAIEPGQTKLIKTGLAFEIPEGYELQVRQLIIRIRTFTKSSFVLVQYRFKGFNFVVSLCSPLSCKT